MGGELAYGPGIRKICYKRELRLNAHRHSGRRLERRSITNAQFLFHRKSVIAAAVLLGFVFVCVVGIAVFSIHNSLEVPRIDRPAEVAWLPQNWTSDQRNRYYHTAQGSELLPYAWFL